MHGKLNLPVCICWYTIQISILHRYVTGNKTASVLVIAVQCSTLLKGHSTSVQITSKLFSSPVQHVVPRQIFTCILYTALWVQTVWPLDMAGGQIQPALDNNLISKMT